MAARTQTYNGNPLLKRKNVKVKFTAAQLKEYEKCSNDVEYFAEKYVKIVHVDRGFINIALYDYQREIIRKFNNSRRVIACTSRQAGKTTTATIIILHAILFNDHKTVALLANKADSAREILDRIQRAYEALPAWLQQGVTEWNKGSVEFENGCKIIAAATSSSAIRGKSIALLYIDETAFVDNWDEFFASVYPTISSGDTTKIILTSTPNGLNHFHKTWIGAKEGTNGYEWVEVPWYCVPGRGEAWKEDTLKSMDYDYEKFAQEYELEFLGSSGTLISGSKLKQLVKRTPLVQKDGIWLYEKPVPGHVYVSIVDTSHGKGLDDSAFQIIDVTSMPYKQVCVFKDNFSPPSEFAEVINRTAKMYNGATLLVEVNDIGIHLAEMLFMDYEYENMINTESAGRAGRRITFNYHKGVDRGIKTTKTVKAIGCSILKLLIEQDQLIVNDHNTIYELSTFSKKANSYEAEEGCKDDLVMCLVLFAWLVEQKYFKEMTDINTLLKLREKTDDELMQELLPFGVFDNGIDEDDDNSFMNDKDDLYYHDFNKSNYVSTDFDKDMNSW